MKYSKLALVSSSVCLALALAGCSSGEKKSDASTGPGGASNSNAPRANGAGSSAANDDDTAISQPISAEKKYQALGAAVRGGQEKAILDEAAKILAVNQNDATALNALALYHFRHGRTGAAKLLLNRALEKNPASAALVANLAVVFQTEGDQGAAIVNYKKALAIDASHAESLGNLGSLYVRGGDYLRGLSLLDQWYKTKSSNAGIANVYAIGLRQAGRFDEASRVYDELSVKNPNDVNALLNHAILLIEFMSKPKDGLPLVYKVKFLETERKDVLARANALEKKAKSELK